jgi:uncharacterized membrane protein YkgB
MKNIIGIIVIIAGIAVFIQGLNRKDSLAGRAADAGTSIANTVDGARQPKHVVYMVVGGLLVLVGAGVMARRGTTVVAR